MPDLLPHGKSDKTGIKGPMWTFHAQSVVGLLDALKIDRPDGPPAPLPDGGQSGRNARDVYYGEEDPTLESMRALSTRVVRATPSAG